MTEHLRYLGCTNIEKGIDDYGFDYNGYSWAVDADKIDDTMTIDEILHEADRISCCGDLLNNDSDMCPTCKEHL